MVIHEQEIVYQSYQDYFLQDARLLKCAINQNPLMQKAFALFDAYKTKEIEFQIVSEEFARINTFSAVSLQQDEKICTSEIRNLVQCSLRTAMKEKYEVGLRVFAELVKQPELTEPYADIQEQFYRIARQYQEETNSISENYLYDASLLVLLKQ